MNLSGHVYEKLESGCEVKALQLNSIVILLYNQLRALILFVKQSLPSELYFDIFTLITFNS